MKEENKSVPAGDEQSIEELRKRYEKLNRRKIQSERDLEHAKQRLDESKQQAREQYGTDDVAELRAKLNKMTAENEEKRREYQASLAQIESDLADVERKFAASEDPPTAGEESP